MIKKTMHVTLFCTLLIFLGFSLKTDVFKLLSLKSKNEITQKIFSKKISKNLLFKNFFPKQIEHNNHKYKVSYTFDDELDLFVRKILKRSHSDYISAVIIDNKTGNILSAVDYDKKNKKYGHLLTFQYAHPAASIFKIITTAELLQNTKVEKNTILSFVGRSTTLYKYQLKSQFRRYKRYLTLKKAFALSNNAVFGKTAIEYLSGIGLYQMAEAFGFNNRIIRDLEIPISYMPMPQSQYNLAEIASGFNKTTQMSPVQGAMIASVVANKGNLQRPKIVDFLVNQKGEKILINNKLVSNKVISEDVADDIKEMMELTVNRGTARGTFGRRFARKNKDRLEIGGKTGTITGGNPHGKHDWFVAYVNPKDQSKSGISICVMIINKKKWYVKSSYIAKRIINHFYKDTI